jgi:hypothetical protein
MQTKKMSLATIQGKLSRNEMKNIMGGDEQNIEGGDSYNCNGAFCINNWECTCWGPIYTNGVACISNQCRHQ